MIQCSLRYLAVLSVFAVTGCDWIERQIAAKTPPRIVGTVIETRGGCHTVLGDKLPDGSRIRYALTAEASRHFMLGRGQRIAIYGYIAEKQVCAAAVLLDVKRIEGAP